jgi:hypothetical protein
MLCGVDYNCSSKVLQQLLCITSLMDDNASYALIEFEFKYFEASPNLVILI